MLIQETDGLRCARQKEKTSDVVYVAQLFIDSSITIYEDSRFLH